MRIDLSHQAIVPSLIANRLKQDGFALIDDLLNPAEINRLGKVLLDTFDEDSAGRLQRTRNIGSHDDPILEICRLSEVIPSFQESPILAQVVQLTSEICGRPCRMIFDHAIYKPAQSRSLTAWHQDAAYQKKPTPAAARIGNELYRLHWWIPFQATGPENGCMAYIKGGHRQGVLAHEQVSHHDGGTREVLATPKGPWHDAPVPVGGAAIHLPQTPHMAYGNHSDAPRLAWIIQAGLTFGQPKAPHFLARIAHWALGR